MRRTCKKFTSDEILLIRRMAMQDKGAAEIAESLGRDVDTVRQKCRNCNIKLVRKDTKFTNDEIDAIVFLSKQGWSANAVARQIGRLPQSVRSKASQIGVSFRLPRGDNALEFRVDDKTKHYLQRAAEARGCHINQLMRQLLFQIVSRDLVNALMAEAYKRQTQAKQKANASKKPAETTPAVQQPAIELRVNVPQLYGVLSFAEDHSGAVMLQGIKPDRLQ